MSILDQSQAEKKFGNISGNHINDVQVFVETNSTTKQYQRRFLTEPNQNANHFLKAIAYDVRVNQLLKVVKTCAYHSEMKYCPVLLQIMHQDLRQIYGGDEWNYLLQVYNDEGVCVFDKVLKYDVVSWNIFFNYFVFKLNDKEDGSGWFYIVQFNQDGQISVSKVQDTFRGTASQTEFFHIGLCKENLFLANNREIKIISFKKANKSQEVNEIMTENGQFPTIMLKNNEKLHGFFENQESKKNNFLLMQVENGQNLMTFQKLTFVDGDSASDIQIHQYREIVQILYNPTPNDAIDYFYFYINKKGDQEMCVGASKRQSGRVDFFYNYDYIDTSAAEYERLELTTRYLYLQPKNQKVEDNKTDEDNLDQEIPVIEIDQASAQRIGETVGEEIKLDISKWDHVVFDKIRNHARIFSSITLINIHFFIAFNKIVAMNDVVTKEWKFFPFTNTIAGLLRNQSPKNAHDLNVGVLLENGEIYLIDRQNRENDDDDGPEEANWDIVKEGDAVKPKLKIDGKILKIVSDWRDISSHYILAKTGGKRALFGYQKNTITPLEKSVTIQDDEQLLRCITPNEKEDFLLYSKSGKTLRSFTNSARSSGDQMLVAQHRFIKINEPQNPVPDTKTNIDKLGDLEFHTAVGSKNHDYILLFNKKDVIKCKVQVKDQTNKDKKDSISHRIYEIEEKLDYNIQNLQVIDGDYCYSLSNESSNQGRPGFYIQNISSFINAGTNQTGNFRLKAATVGQNDLLDYYKDDQRLAYISSYDCIRIVPLLHRQTLGFIGMRPRKEYLGFRKYKERICALDKKGNFTTWFVLTGKIDSKTKAKITDKKIDLTNYQIYQNGKNDITYRSEWYQQHILLFDKKNPVKDIDQAEFFKARNNLDAGAETSFVMTLDKKFLKFKVIEIVYIEKDQKIVVDVLEHFTFYHPYYGDENFQRLFFSEKLDLMLERQDQNVFLYDKAPSPAGTAGSLVTWQLKKRIMRFPMDLASVTFVNYLFSPNFQYYLDFNKSKKVFVIKNTLEQTDKVTIPSGLMHPGSGKDIALVGKKFKWVSNSQIRVINNDGIEKTVDIENECDQVSYCSVPMLDMEYLRSDNASHFFYDVSITRENQTIERLKRKYQQYFTAINQGQTTETEDLYNILFNVDFNIDNCKGKLVSDTSFTYFHLKIAELMQIMHKFNLKRYHPEEVKVLALNIFPHGRTVLHYAYQNLNIVRRFYKVIEAEVEKAKQLAASNDQDVSSQGFFEIPFLKTFSGDPKLEGADVGMTPLHLCMNSGNYKSADIILQKLCNDPLDSHSRAINDIIPQLVEEELPSLGKYFDSRFGQTNLLQEHSFRRGCIKKYEDLEIGITVSELWPDKHQLKGKLFDKAAPGEKEKPEAECKVEFLDIVGMHCYTEEVGDQFFEALAGSTDLNLFSYRSVQAIIDFKYPLAREYTMKVLFFPFCFYLAVFVAWSNAFNQSTYDFSSWYSMWVADKVLCALLYFFSVYFLSNELRQMYHSGFDYFTSLWNYCDFLPSSLIIAIVSIKLRIQFYASPDDNHIYTPVLVSFHALASFLMWIKLLYFMRIYKETGYLVKTISECIYGMRIFLFIFLTTLIAFNEAFTRIDEAFKSDEPDAAKFQGKNWAQGYAFTFALAAGDTRADNYDVSQAPVIVWFIFCMVLLVMNVVMLNLLVAIISKSFEEINEQAESAMYRERASIIAENSYLIPWYRKKEHCADKDQYLVITRDLLSEENDTGAVEAVQNKLNEIETSLNDFKNEYRENQEEFFEKVKTAITEGLAKK